MKRIIYSSFAVALVALSSCSDELVENPAAPAQTGDEITFGSSLTDVQTRTIYGEDPVNGAYPVYWEDGDQISIYCPEAAQGNLVSYKITPNEQDATTSSAVTKVNADQAGLQWGQQETHHFSAIYPADKITGVQDGKLTASIPVDQTPTEWKYDAATKTWTGIASTDYAYMWAYGTHNKSEGGDVALEFHPWVTILDVEITGPKSGQMKMSSVQIRSNDYETLNGEFQIDFKPVEDGTKDAPVYIQAGNPNATRSQISIQLYDPKYYEHKQVAGKTGGDFITLDQGEKIVVRFYLLPKDMGYDTSNGRKDLQIRVAPYNMAVLTRTLTSQDGHEDAGKGGILPHKVNRVILPPVNDAGANYWMSSLNPNIYVTELSLPGSKFSYQNRTDQPRVGSIYQTLSVAKQMQNGIRAFHVQTYGINEDSDGPSMFDDGGDASSMTLGVSVGEETSNISFKQMVETVANGLKEAEDAGKTGEYAFILLTYTGSHSEGYGFGDYEIIGGRQWKVDAARAWMQAIKNDLAEMEQSPDTYRLYTGEITPNTTIGQVAGRIIVKVNYNTDAMANYLATTDRVPALFSIWGVTDQTLDDFEPTNAYAINMLRWGTSNHNVTAGMKFFYHEATSVGNEESAYDKENNIIDMWNRSIAYYANDTHDMWFMNDLGGYYYGGRYNEGESQDGIDDWTAHIGPVATEYLHGRDADATLGIVLMNYADPDNQYSGNLIQSIINNNFLFQLRTAGAAQADSFDATYQNGGNAIGWQ